MAEDDKVVQEVSLEGADETAAAFQRVGEAAEKAFDQVAEGAKKAEGATGPDPAALNASAAGYDKVEAAARSFGGALRDVADHTFDLVKSLPKLAGALSAIGGAATGAMFALAKNAANVADAVRDAGIRAGVASQSFQKLGFAFSQNGSSAADLVKALALINSGSNKVRGALAGLGVEFNNTDGSARSADEILKDVADKIAEIEDPAERSRKAIEVFGRRLGPQMVEALSQGRKGLEEFGKEAERIGIILSEADKKIGDDFNDALGKLGDTLQGLATRVGLIFGPSFTKIFNQLTESVIVVTPYILQLATAFDSYLGPSIDGTLKFLGPFGTALTGVGLAVATLVLGLGILLKVLGPIGNILKVGFAPFLIVGRAVVSLFGLMAKSATLVFTLLRLGFTAAAAAAGTVSLPVLALAAAIGFLAVALYNVDWARVGAVAVAMWEGIKTAANNAWISVTTLWGQFTSFMSGIWERVKQFGTDVWTSIQFAAAQAWQGIQTTWNDAVAYFTGLWETVRQGASDAWNSITGVVGSAINSIKSTLDGLISKLNSVWEAAKRAFSAAGGGGGAPAPGFAGGGKVRGPGSSTSDSIWAKLSNGEFVHKARAVSYYGHSFMDAVNNMRLPRDILGFANGGLVATFNAPLVPRFAGGGPVASSASSGGGSPVVLNIGGEQFNLVTAEDDTAHRLSKFTTRRRLASAGRKPSSHGG